jgi:predicted metal-dependent phosphoesterase TrpH
MRYDLHIHSKYSYDSNLSLKKILYFAKKRGLNGIAITDHNTIKGALETKKINKDKDFIVIIGTEIKTEYGDVLGLFLNEKINTKNFFEVIDSIKSQNGLSVLAHPYAQYKKPEILINKVDLIEGFNARSKKIFNKATVRLCKKFNKRMTAGSDAHSFFEIGRGFTDVDMDIEKALRNGVTKIYGNETNYFLSHGISVFIEKKKMLKSN